MVERDVYFHLSCFVKELSLLEFLAHFREGELDQQIFGEIVYFLMLGLGRVKTH